jgi:hypothetical protein
MDYTGDDVRVAHEPVSRVHIGVGAGENDCCGEPVPFL